MKRKSTCITLFVGVVLSVAAALALAAEDKYTVKVPGGLGLSASHPHFAAGRSGLCV